MARIAPIIAEESALLCEGCGYIVSGLPEESRCPECGKAIAESLPDTRRLPIWEREGGWWRRFWGTTWEVIVQPARFYRAMRTREGFERSRQFGRLHLWISSVLLGLAMLNHAAWMTGTGVMSSVGFVLRDYQAIWSMIVGNLVTPLVGWAVATIVVYLAMTLTTRLAVRLTAWEAAYRGLRLPLCAVRRALHYHSAHYLPVAVVAVVTVVGNLTLIDLGVLSDLTAMWYLYVLCGEVVLGAVYLFKTYWTGMRNIMYANG